MNSSLLEKQKKNEILNREIANRKPTKKKFIIKTHSDFKFIQKNKNKL